MPALAGDEDGSAVIAVEVSEQTSYDAPTPCGPGEQIVEGSDLGAILFGHGGFNIAKR